MALERKTLREILEDETTDTSGKLKKILDVLHKETDTLQNQLDEKDAALAKAEKDRDAANGGKQAAEKALTDYKAQQTQKDTRATKAAAYKQLLKDNGVLEKHFDRVVKMTGADIDALELDENGTKAAAVTAVVTEAASAEPPEVHRVVLDRPFVYMIVDTHANLPLFLGTVTQMDG